MFLLSPWPIDASGVQRKAAAPKIAFGHLAIFAHFRRFLLSRSMTCRSENKVRGERFPPAVVDSLVPEGGLEPPRGYPHRILSPARLPFHHSGTRINSITYNAFAFKNARPDFRSKAVFIHFDSFSVGIDADVHSQCDNKAASQTAIKRIKVIDTEGDEDRNRAAAGSDTRGAR